MPWNLDHDDIITVRGVQYSLPLRRMRLGDSIFIPTLKHREVRRLVFGAVRRYNYTLRARPATLNGYVGIRVWRVA